MNDIKTYLNIIFFVFSDLNAIIIIIEIAKIIKNNSNML